MHRYYSLDKMIEDDMQRAKRGEMVMYKEKDLECDGRAYDRVTELDKDNNVISDVYHNEVKEIIESRGSSSYSEIAEDAGEIMHILGDDIRFTYFFSQIANKLARLKHRYSVEDSLLDIAGYATLELERLRNEKDK